MMYKYLFEVNKQNAYTLAEKHNITDYDRDYIRANYFPIIKVNNFDLVNIKEKLNTLKNDFVKENTIFDLDIFNRKNTEYLIYELNQYIDILKRGKVKTWNKYNADFFHIFKIESELPEKILLISDKDLTQLEVYFKTVLNTIQSFIKQPPQAKNISKDLPQLEDVFFVHYQREDFEAGSKIYNLSIYLNGKVIDFSTETETEIIYNFSKKVLELCSSGLIPIHWNQTAPHYGIDHIKSRYKELTGNNLILDYVNDINLAEWCVYNYGENYISHPRLDTLAVLNNFNGITDKESRIFHTQRLKLLTKIYFNALSNTLKVETPCPDLSDTSTVGKNSFINNFDSVPESKVVEYFTKNLVDKKYITVEVLNEYLKQAFELKKPPTQRFCFTKLNTQGKIKIVFYEYFKITAGKPIGRKKEYVELLGEYFTGFDTLKLMTNFSK